MEGRVVTLNVDILKQIFDIIEGSDVVVGSSAKRALCASTQVSRLWKVSDCICIIA
jgi:hypothetical protein